MKNPISSLWLILALLTVSCGVVSLDEQAAGDTIAIDPAQYPENNQTLTTALTDNTSKSWSTTGFNYHIVKRFQACRLDDTITLLADNTYQYDGGDLLCGAEDDTRKKSGTWEANYEGRKLTFDKGTSHEVELYIEEASENQIIVSATYMNVKVVGRYELAL